MKKVLLFVSILLLAGCNITGRRNTAKLSPIIEKALNEKNSHFYADFEAFPRERVNLPIALFASDTSGRVILERLLTIDTLSNITGKEGSDGIPDFAGENFTFLAEIANGPYLGYVTNNRIDYLRELAVKDALFLLGSQYWSSTNDGGIIESKEPSKIILVGCNTSAFFVKSSIDTLLKRSNTSVKALSIVDAGVNGLLKATKREPAAAASPASVAILAEELMEATDIYGKRISEKAGKAGLNILCPSLAGLKEAIAKDSTEALLKERLIALLEEQRGSIEAAPIKYILLAEPLYATITNTIEKQINELKEFTNEEGEMPYKELISDSLVIVEPAIELAAECYRILRENDLLSLSTADGVVNNYISSPAENLENKYYRYGREVGTEEITTIYKLESKQ